MNSQFLPPQPMGNPQQGFQQQPGYQNVSLVAPSKNDGGPPPMGGTNLPPQQFPPSTGNMPQPPRQFTPSQLPSGQLPPSQLPPSQLPPSQRPPSQNSFPGPPQRFQGGQPPQKSAFSSVSPSQFPPNVMGSAQNAMGGPQNAMGGPQNVIGGPSVQQMPPRPGSNLPPGAQLPSNPTSMAQNPPTSGNQPPGGPLPSNPKGMAQSPPQLPVDPNSVSQTGLETFTESPPTNTSGSQPPQPFNNTSSSPQKPPHQKGGFLQSFDGPSPPSGGLPPPVSSSGGQPTSGALLNGVNPLTSSSNHSGMAPPGNFNFQPPNQPQPPVNQGGGPLPPQQTQQQPPLSQFDAIPSQNQPSMPGQPPMPGHPPSNQFGGAQQPRMPPVSQGMPPPNRGQIPPPGSFPGGPPAGPGGVGRPPIPGASGPPSISGQRPPQNYPPMPGQPSPRNQPFPPGSAPPQAGGQPMLPQGGQFGQGPPGGQFQPPTSQFATPLGGQFPPQGQLPGQLPPQGGQLPHQGGQLPPHGGQLPPPGGNFGQPNQMPPLPGQVNGSNHLSNQMQGMNLGGPRQYPKNFMNGDHGPHMPPPLNQQQNYLNGPQPPSNQQWGSAPGYPPMPQPPTNASYSQGPMGGPMGGAYPQQPSYQDQQQAQQRRLDPDQMPNPIEVTQEDQRTRSGPFVTNQKGLMPPLVTTNFVVQDQGNASPRFIRSTMYNVPITQDAMKQTAVPFALAISPMARTLDDEYPPPIVNFGDLGPVRCVRCKAYMCPFMQFIDSGRRFQCLFCKATTDVPAEYFQHLDQTGQRMDRFERPELVLGTYEFVATADYCRNNTLPKPPAFIFVIDVSYNNMKSGMVQLLCSQMKEILKNLPVDQGQDRSTMKVGFITYNSSVHFYNIKGTLAAPQMMVVGDTQEMFMPLLDGFLASPEESEAVIDALMEQIPIMFGDTKETETVLLPAILGGLEALKASERAGKLLVFHSTLPSAEAPGKLKNRDDRKLLGTDKERTVLTPQTQAYNQLGQDCVQAGCSVDLFIFNNAFIDIATIGQVARLSGGEVFKYTYFQADTDGDRLIKDIVMDLSRPIAFDSIMRVRTSTGVRPTDFYGHFFMSNTTDMELASIDCDKAVAVEIKHDDKLSEEEGVYIQAALLYTSVSGQRRLRIINLSLKTCSQMADLYRSCDLDTIINYIAKQSTFKLLDNSPKAVKDAIVNRAAQILATYRKNCASPSSAGQLILPECMKLLPLYVNCLLKSDALSGGSDMTIDDRAFVMQAVMTMDVQTSVNYFYPRLIPLHEIDVSQEQYDIPNPVRCSVGKITEDGVYLLENGIHMFLWVGLGASPKFTQNVFGAPSAVQVDIERNSLPALDNPLSLAVRNIIEEVRLQRHRCMRLTIVRQREKLEPVFKHFLVEDRGTDGSASYVDFLCHMHREIRSLLS